MSKKKSFSFLLVVLQTRKCVFVVAYEDSLWLFLPVKRRFRMRDLGAQNTYNIGKTGSQHVVLKNIRQELFSQNILTK